MEVQPYRALRMALRVFALLTLVGSLLLIFSDRPLMLRVLVRPPESEVSTLLLFIVREMGGLFLMFGVLLFLASRDPVRNVAIILFGRSTFAHSILRTFVWGCSVVQLAIAVQVDSARALLAGTTTDAIRNTAELRSQVRQGMAQIADRLGTMVSDRVGRKFRFAD